MTQYSDFFVGTYSAKAGKVAGGGEGIYSCRLSLDNGALSTPVCAADCTNPSYLTWGKDRRFLYAASELFTSEGPAVLAFEVGANHSLRTLGSQPMDGELPCHLSTDSSGLRLASAQYWTGDTLLFPLMQDGRIASKLTSIQHNGSGPNAKRQEGPHAHFAGFLSNPDELAIVDLGLDRIFLYPFDTERGELDLDAQKEVVLPPGAGPRHLTAAPDEKKIYVLCELSEQIILFDRFPEGWTQVQQIQAFGESANSDGAAAAIRISPDNRFLYASGRTQSEIACFSIDAVTGRLSPVQHIPSGGKGPRDFALSPDGRFVVVANQHTNNLTSFRRDEQTGCLCKTGHTAAINDAVCVLF
ncbi:MAG TPA: lactonase family protein [Devosia sp.]|nr:lactonase family protein [Devosia sp.]